MTRAEAIEQAARALLDALRWEQELECYVLPDNELAGKMRIALRDALAMPDDAPSTVTRAVDAAILAHREARASVALDGETHCVDEEGP